MLAAVGLTAQVSWLKNRHWCLSLGGIFTCHFHLQGWRVRYFLCVSVSLFLKWELQNILGWLTIVISSPRRLKEDGFEFKARMSYGQDPITNWKKRRRGGTDEGMEEQNGERSEREGEMVRGKWTYGSTIFQRDNAIDRRKTCKEHIEEHQQMINIVFSAHIQWQLYIYQHSNKCMKKKMKIPFILAHFYVI